jgi:hypothetical protein
MQFMPEVLFGRWPRWKWARRLGRRGAILTVFGLMDCLFGAAALVQPPGGPNAAEDFLIWPDWIWATSWFTVAAICLAQAWVKNDALAFAAAMAIKMTYAAAYLVAYWQTDLYRGWASFGFWFLFGCLVLLLAGWTDDKSLPTALLIVTAKDDQESDAGLEETLTNLRELHHPEGE